MALFYQGLLVFGNNTTERQDCILKGKIQGYSEIAGLSEVIKEELKKKSKGVN